MPSSEVVRDQQQNSSVKIERKVESLSQLLGSAVITNCNLRAPETWGRLSTRGGRTIRGGEAPRAPPPSSSVTPSSCSCVIVMPAADNVDRIREQRPGHGLAKSTLCALPKVDDQIDAIGTQRQ